MYRVKSKRPSRFDFDLIVIGSGAGGGVAALIASSKGKKVAIVEADQIGGECPNYGCVPTKSLLQSAEVYQIAKNAGQFGIRTSSVKYDYTAINAWKDKAVMRTGAKNDTEAYKSNGITVLRGYAHFLSPWQIALSGNRYSAKNFLIATGTKSIVPPIEGLREVGYVGFREAIALKHPPKSVFIIGGGAIGCEFAQLFWSFDAKVHIAEIDNRLMSREDREVGELIAKIFEKKDISVHVNTKVVKVISEDGKKIVTLESEGRRRSVIVDEVLLAAGKTPNLDLGLDNAGVRYNRRGLIINSRMQTSAKHIYAAGDVVGPYMFTHTAVYQSRIAAHNMYNKKKTLADYRAVPLCIFVDPEVASVGLSEENLRNKGVKIQVGFADISVISRSNTTNQPDGFVKVMASESGVILGACIVAPRAGEMIHELALAVHKKLRAQDIVSTIHAFPTWSEAVRVACAQIKNT